MLNRSLTSSCARAGAVVAALLTTLVPNVATAEPPLVTLTFVLVRTSQGPTSYQLNASAWNDGRGSFIGSVGAIARHGRVVGAEASPAGSAGRWENETVRAGGTRWSACDHGVCFGGGIEGYQGLGSTFTDPKGDSPVTHVFVVLVGTRAAYDFTARGWKVVRMPLGFRYLDGSESAPVSVKASVAGAEAYLDGTLPGGRRGSLAVGVPPCSGTVTSLVHRGVGRLTLDGGVRSESVTCPADQHLPVSYATGATTWRFHGVAVGDTMNRDTRLFVLDIPARLP